MAISVPNLKDDQRRDTAQSLHLQPEQNNLPVAAVSRVWACQDWRVWGTRVTTITNQRAEGPGSGQEGNGAKSSNPEVFSRLTTFA